MMKILFPLIFVFVFVFCFSAVAAEKGSMVPKSTKPKDIIKYVKAAVDLVAEKGEVEAFKELTDPNGPWVSGQWYIFVNHFDGYNVAHLNKKIEGKNLMALRDVKGNAFYAELQRIGQSKKGSGWAEYWWPRPNSKEHARKLGYVMRIPGKKLWIGTGAYDVSDEDVRKVLSRQPNN